MSEPRLTPDGNVKVLIYPAEYESPYDWEWMDRPWSVGFPLGESDFELKHYEITREQYIRWLELDLAFRQRQEEMDALVRDRRGGKDAGYQARLANRGGNFRGLPPV